MRPGAQLEASQQKHSELCEEYCHKLDSTERVWPRAYRIAGGLEGSGCPQSPNDEQESRFGYRIQEEWEQIRLVPTARRLNPSWFQFLMLMEKVSPAADEPEYWVVGQPP
eukprot:1162105-Pelagomonas_calceolata.AAC.1